MGYIIEDMIANRYKHRDCKYCSYYNRVTVVDEDTGIIPDGETIMEMCSKYDKDIPANIKKRNKVCNRCPNYIVSIDRKYL